MERITNFPTAADPYFKELQEILKELHIVSGFRMSLYDSERRQICAWPKELTPFCNLIQKNQRALSCCHSFDKSAFETVQRTNEVCIYRCHCGLYEAVAPLYHFGVLSGYLMMGQSLDTTETNRDAVFRNAVAYVSDAEELKRCISKIPSRSKEQIESCISIMKICASYISLSNYLKAPDKDLPTRIRLFLLQNYASNISLDSLCNEFYCSRATLTASFRKAYGKSIMEYLNAVRMEKGRELLAKNSQLSIREIAENCGFSDQNYFTKAFRKYHGMTPRESRNLFQKQL
ncbi:MAG: PocR ligand-binding domain-containing protein [bacterium]|nr:PocR ligand-binding domain-containing protein [bacterium]